MVAWAARRRPAWRRPPKVRSSTATTPPANYQLVRSRCASSCPPLPNPQVLGYRRSSVQPQRHPHPAAADLRLGTDCGCEIREQQTSQSRADYLELYESPTEPARWVRQDLLCSFVHMAISSWQAPALRSICPICLQTWPPQGLTGCPFEPAGLDTTTTQELYCMDEM